MQMGYEKFTISTNMSLYFQNGCSYYGMPLGTCMQSVEWWRFQYLRSSTQ